MPGAQSLTSSCQGKPSVGRSHDCHTTALSCSRSGDSTARLWHLNEDGSHEPPMVLPHEPVGGVTQECNRDVTTVHWNVSVCTYVHESYSLSFSCRQRAICWLPVHTTEWLDYGPQKEHSNPRLLTILGLFLHLSGILAATISLLEGWTRQPLCGRLLVVRCVNSSPSIAPLRWT